MSRRRPRASLTVSLFPFLAVLVCAMGALIFLLIVTTRMIPDESEVATVTAAIQEPEPKLPPVEIDTRSAEELQSAPLFQSPPAEESVSVSVSVNVAAPTPDDAQDESSHKPPVEEPALPDPNIGLRKEIAHLKNQRQRQRRELRQQRLAVARANEKLARDGDAMQDIEHELTEIKEAQQRVESDRSAIDAERSAFLRRTADAKRQIADLKRAHARASSEFAIIPYDGKSGTTRRPIFIECTEKGLRFLPEDLFLVPSQLEGFTDRYNPLLVGSRALIAYWNAQKRSSDDGASAPDPYVLLLVRPGGSIAYYLARKFLTHLNQPFGYELIEEDFTLHLPAADAQATRILQQAVAQVLEHRKDISRSYAAHGSLGGWATNLSSFQRPDVEDVDEMLSMSGSSNAARFAHKNRLYRQRLKQQQDSPDASLRSSSTSMDAAGVRRRGSTKESPARRRQAGVAALSPSGKTPTNPRNRRTIGSDSTLNAATGSPLKFSGSQLSDRRVNDRTVTLYPEPPSQQGADVQLGSRNFTPQVPKRNDAYQSPRSRRHGTAEASEAGTSRKMHAAARPHLPQSGAEVDGGPGKPIPHVPPPFSQSQLSPSQSGRATTGSTDRMPQQRSSQDSATASTGTSQQPYFRPLVLGTTKTPDLSKRPWGLTQQRAGIGIERAVRIDVFWNRLVVGGDQPAIAVGRGESSEELSARVVHDIDAFAQTWGPPPADFYWLPTIRFRVYPGGNQFFERIHRLLSQGGLSSSVEYLLEEPRSPGNFR